MASTDLNADSKTQLSDNRSNTRFSSSVSSTANSNSSFLAAAHKWLVDNLYNPYPTTEIKARMSAASSCQLSSINSWFANARRRIGWTTLCREHFSNCRADMIDAAYRALVEEDPRRMLSPELSHSFVAMKVAAEGLLQSTFTKSTFSKDLDVVLKDMVEKDSESVIKHRQVEKAIPTEVHETDIWGTSCVAERESLQVAQDSYPSPDPSITASPVSALDDTLTDEREEDVGHSINASSKRRRSSIDPVNEPSSTDIRPIKRLRTSITARTYLPSPASSTDGIDGPSDDGSPELSHVDSSLSEPNKLLPSRKRRLSVTDAAGTPHRLSDSLAAPCLHTVSDPLPRTNMENEYSIDDWFSTNFDDLFVIPPPVDATEPDFSASWEVELFKDYNVPGNPEYTPECPPALAGHIPTLSDLSELDILLQSLDNDARVAPSDSVLPPIITGPANTVSLDSSVPDISQTNIDWTSLLNEAEAYQPVDYPAFFRYPGDFQPPPEIDLSMLQLPEGMPAVDSQGDSASKQAKLHQLHAMQEAVRRMEQELRSEGVVI